MREREQTPEALIRGWAKAYRDTPEHRFPSDPHAEFFPVDLDAAADEIKRLTELAKLQGQEIRITRERDEALERALTDIIEANRDFRDGMPQSWDGDPLQDACDAAAKLLPVPVGGVRHD